jgi:hypothetical protein
MICSWAGYIKVELMALAAKVILLSTSMGNAGKNKNKEYGIVDVYFMHGARFIFKKSVVLFLHSTGRQV